MKCAKCGTSGRTFLTDTTPAERWCGDCLDKYTICYRCKKIEICVFVAKEDCMYRPFCERCFELVRAEYHPRLGS